MSGRAWVIEVCRTCDALAQWPFCAHRDAAPAGGRWTETVIVRTAKKRPIEGRAS